MPRGIPKYREMGTGPSSNTQRLLEAMAELQARIDAERAKDRARALLLAFCAKHALTAHDLREAAKQLGDRKVGDVPVFSKQLPQRGRKGFRPDKMKPAKGKVGKAIRAARLKAKLTDRDIGDRIGIATSQVQRWQQGVEVPEHLRAPLADVLKLPKGTFAEPAKANGAAHA